MKIQCSNLLQGLDLDEDTVLKSPPRFYLDEDTVLKSPPRLDLDEDTVLKSPPRIRFG